METSLLAGCGKTHLFMKSLSAPCHKTGFLRLVLPLWGRLQRGQAGCGTPFPHPAEFGRARADDAISAMQNSAATTERRSMPGR